MLAKKLVKEETSPKNNTHPKTNNCPQPKVSTSMCRVSRSVARYLTVATTSTSTAKMFNHLLQIFYYEYYYNLP